MKLGHVYKKAVLREFTDETFTVQKPRQPWMGILGPVLIGEVGDILNIVFYNMASHPVSMHPHGVRYQKIHEGKSLLKKHCTSCFNKVIEPAMCY